MIVRSPALILVDNGWRERIFAPVWACEEATANHWDLRGFKQISICASDKLTPGAIQLRWHPWSTNGAYRRPGTDGAHHRTPRTLTAFLNRLVGTAVWVWIEEA